MKRVWVYIENGIFFEADSFGAEGTRVGELIFNTSLTGYQEIISDPSYAGQFILFTMPEIGNVGCNRFDLESNGAFCSGIVVRNYNEAYSNYRAEESLSEFLKRYGIIGISGVDTRSLTKMIRDSGPKMMIASTKIDSKDELKKMLSHSKRIEEINFMDEVSTKSSYIHKFGRWNGKEYKKASGDTKIVLIDFGVKRNILNELSEVGFIVEVINYNFDEEELINRYKKGEIKGVFLSNGPGDPLVLTNIHKKIEKLIDADIPLMGICLGHQLLSIANGFKTYKLDFGHHGGNHPVKNLKTGRIEITAQNHNYNVPEAIVNKSEVVYKNLFDNTIEGVVYTKKRVFSVQYHPEASPGPHDSRYIFKEFYSFINANRRD